MSGICIYSGSSLGNREIYAEVAKSIGDEIGIRNHSMVYGGGDFGLMGVTARAALKRKVKVKGIIPQAMVGAGEKGKGEKESALELYNDPNMETIIVDNMQERILQMALNSKAFVGLPGGYGTLAELIDMTTMSQLNIHNKPVIAVNVNGFYEPLKLFIVNAVESGFISEANAKLIHFVDETEGKTWGQAALDAVEKWTPSGEEYNFKWN